jgi:hypothetical protein
MLALLAQQPDDGTGMLLAGGFIVIWGLLVLVGFVLFLWALIDCIKNPNLSDTQRIIWILVILFVGCVGPIAYLIAGRNTAPPPSQTP